MMVELPGGGDARLVTPEQRWLYASPHDAFIWERARLTSDRLEELANHVTPRIPTGESLLADLFSAFYRSEVRRAEASDPSVEVNRAILDRVLTSSAYHRLQPVISGDADDAILVVDAFARSLADSLDQELADFLGAEAAYHAEKQRLEAEQQALSARKGRKRKGEAAMSAAERKARLAELAEEIESLEHNHRTDYKLMRGRARLRRDLEAADLAGQLAEVEAALDDFSHAAGVWGLDAGEESQLPLDERLALFQHYLRDEKLRRATELLGRARTRATGTHRSLTKSAPVQVAGVKLGSDLTAVLPSEAVLLADPVAETEFYRRYASDELSIRTYRYEGKPDRGPVVVCVDESASMAGERELNAKAIALAVIGIARTDKRTAALVEFASASELRLTRFAVGETSLVDVCEALTHFFGGGTDFDRPIAAALDLIGAEKTFSDADVLVITDGEAPLHEQTRERLLAAKRDGARLHVLGVGVTEDTFAEVATTTWNVTELFGSEADEALAAAIAAIH